MVDTGEFGVLPDGTRITMHTIRNSKGEYVEILNRGASLHRIHVLDGFGRIGDVTLGARNAVDLAGYSFEGVTIGRCANRIAFGRFEIDGKVTQLDCNLDGHCLHSAGGNYARAMFSAEVLNPQTVKMSYRDPGESGFDCSVDVSIVFRFDDDSRLQIEYEMEPHGNTVLCPTNHAYFNLSGGDIREHDLRIDADSTAWVDQYKIPDGRAVDVSGRSSDFRALRNIREAMESDTTGFFKSDPHQYDDFFLLNGEGFRQTAELVSRSAGRRMNVYTDMPCIILYTPYPRTPRDGKDGRTYEGYCAVCLETQFVPNAVNCPQFASPVFKTGERLSSTTVYEFTTI